MSTPEFRAAQTFQAPSTPAASAAPAHFESLRIAKVRDDHLALNAAGIPAVDVIDFE